MRRYRFATILSIFIFLLAVRLSFAAEEKELTALEIFDRIRPDRRLDAHRSRFRIAQFNGRAATARPNGTAVTGDYRRARVPRLQFTFKNGDLRAWRKGWRCFIAKEGLV